MGDWGFEIGELGGMRKAGDGEVGWGFVGLAWVGEWG
jgi:hypothetical protein